MKENPRITVTKQMLKDGLLRLLQSKKLEDIRVNELCAISEVNRSTFYRHYETPKDVLQEVQKEIIRQTLPSTRPKSEAEIRDMMEHICTVIYENSGIVKILFRCNTDADLMEYLNRLYTDFWEIREQKKQYPHVDDATAQIALALLGGGCYCLIRQWILEDIPKTPKQIANILCSMIRWPESADF